MPVRFVVEAAFSSLDHEVPPFGRALLEGVALSHGTLCNILEFDFMVAVSVVVESVEAWRIAVVLLADGLLVLPAHVGRRYVINFWKGRVAGHLLL